VVGLVLTASCHLLLVLLLAVAMDVTGAEGTGAVDDPLGTSPLLGRRMSHMEVSTSGKRALDGAIPRKFSSREVGIGRRGIEYFPERRLPEDGVSRDYRSIEVDPGRRFVHFHRRNRLRTIDWGEGDSQLILEAMVIPRLGGKAPGKGGGLPKLIKYEAPEFAEDGININQDNPEGGTLAHKSHRGRSAQLDRRRRGFAKLGNIIDAGEYDDGDPRRRATAMEDIEGVAWGSVDGTGTEGKEGNVYLGRVTLDLRRAFSIPVFLSKEELRKLVVEIEIQQMDDQGRVLSYRIRKSSTNQAFNSAALQAVKEFVPSEGGNRRFAPPPQDLLRTINRSGILVRLEGRSL
jgi:TonB family protein